MYTRDRARLRAAEGKSCDRLSLSENYISHLALYPTLAVHFSFVGLLVESVSTEKLCERLRVSSIVSFTLILLLRRGT